MKIIYQDQDLLVIDKPAGLSVNDLEKQLPENNLPRNGIIHRLDKDTSGVLMIAKNEKNLQFFQKKFKNREIEKTYIALVNGEIKQKTGTIRTLITRKGIKQKVELLKGPQKTGARQAITNWKVLQKYKNYTLLEVKPETGRKHQIRVHLSYLGYPVLGDKLYSFKHQEKLERHYLHAYSIKTETIDGEIKTFKAELPKEFKKYVKET